MGLTEGKASVEMLEELDVAASKQPPAVVSNEEVDGHESDNLTGSRRHSEAV